MLETEGKCTVNKGTVLFSQGESLSQICIVLKGKVLEKGDWYKVVRANGSVLALNQLGSEVYQATFTALEDLSVYVMNIKSDDPIRDLAAKGGDFRAIMISSQFNYVTNIAKIKADLKYRAERLYQFAEKAYKEYCNICEANGLQSITLDELDNLTPYESEEDIYEDKMRYFQEASKIPLAAHKMYFSYGDEMVTYQAAEVRGIVESYKEECQAMVDYIKDLLFVTGLRTSHNFFEYACIQATEMRRQGEVPMEMQHLLKEMLDEGKFQYDELCKQCENIPKVEFSQMSQKVAGIISKEMTVDEKKSLEEKQASVQRDIVSLKGSMNQIIKFADFDEEKSQKLCAAVDFMVHTPDRLSVEDDVKKAKKTLTPLVFDLYLQCYRQLRAGHTTVPKSVDLFMTYGMLDERLLDQEQLEFLCSVDKEQNEGPCNVYTMVEWLDLIQEGKRDPSKSEFDEDYVENLRSLKKQGEITEAQQKELLNNMDKRVEYEVMNMQMANSKTVYGQPSSYMPILYKEAIFGYLDKILVTKKRINECVNDLLGVDYSIFYREVIYSNLDLKITNETVLKNVYPDVILFPLFGLNASMWQEIGGKNKGTPGRFCFPIMTNSNIEDLMVKVFGQFRWELCRCIQGMAWNDVKVKSLTSEYMDYIQFYRKNRELSDEAKEKVKLQIQKARNNSREIFRIDYEMWIKNESNGSMKMNKVAREILATYCPFDKALRTKLNAQRPYEVAMARHGRENIKKKQEFELKVKAVQKITEDVPKELLDTYKFYAEK